MSQTRATTHDKHYGILYRRGVHDVVHKVTAVGSRGIESASAFVNELIDAGHAPVKAYGSYAEVYSDPVCRILSDVSPPQPMTAFQDVDAIYIGLLQLRSARPC